MSTRGLAMGFVIPKFPDMSKVLGSCPPRNAKAKACTSLAIPKMTNKMSNDISRALTLSSSE